MEWSGDMNCECSLSKQYSWNAADFVAAQIMEDMAFLKRATKQTPSEMLDGT